MQDKTMLIKEYTFGMASFPPMLNKLKDKRHYSDYRNKKPEEVKPIKRFMFISEATFEIPQSLIRDKNILHIQNKMINRLPRHNNRIKRNYLVYGVL